MLVLAVALPNIWALPTRGGPVIGPGFPLARGPLGRSRDALLRGLVDRLFDRGLPTLNAVRREHGLPPLRSLYDQVLDTDRIVVLSSPAFDFAAPFVPDNVTYAGPVLDDPDWAEAWQPPWPERNGDPLVLVGFSSTFQQQGPLLRRVVEALSSLPVRAVVTLGPMLPGDEVHSTANVAVVPSAPHGPILRHAAVTVTHGGHGTVMKSLAAGVPMVCIPMGRDQNDNAARLVHHGAGVRLPVRASVSRIATAIDAVLTRPTFTAAARALATTMADESRTIDVALELEGLATATATATTRSPSAAPSVCTEEAPVSHRRSRR